MKRFVLWTSLSILGVGAVVWTIAQVAPAQADLPALFPDNALLYIQAHNFGKLLDDWNSSEEKRAWITGDDYAAFSRSRLFERLAQAQDEFSAAATIPTNESLLSSIAGTESALALYDIGNLQFVYVTRMPESKIEATPLWQVRDKFEQRTEGSANFFVRVDQQSSRTAAFAALDGWLILGTRDDLVAGVLDRLQGSHSHSLLDESWYADAVKQAAGPAGDFRMVLNLEKLVPSPYFRSYWIQRNVTEMKQYRAAISDLYRASGTYRESRVLLRKPGIGAAASGDVRALISLVPQDAVFGSAQASPGVDSILAVLREDILELKPVRQQVAWTAPPAQVDTANAGRASMLEARIDVAPVIAPHADPYQSLRGLLNAMQPSAMLEAYSTRSTQDDMFVSVDRAVVLDAKSPWSETALQSAISAALRPGLTASQLGVEWAQHTSAAETWSSLTGEVPLFLAIRDNNVFLASSESLLNALLARRSPSERVFNSPITYGAVFRHSPREQDLFRKLVSRLDTAGHTASNPDAGSSDGQSPAFFSGNIASLSRMFARVDRETVEEQDNGTGVTQTVVYHWQHP